MGLAGIIHFGTVSCTVLGLFSLVFLGQGSALVVTCSLGRRSAEWFPWFIVHFLGRFLLTDPLGESVAGVPFLFPRGPLFSPGVRVRPSVVLAVGAAFLVSSL